MNMINNFIVYFVNCYACLSYVTENDKNNDGGVIGTEV